MVFRILPDVQMSPLGGVMLWAFIALAVIGVMFSSGIGGALIWAGAWLIIITILYVVVSNFLSWVF